MRLLRPRVPAVTGTSDVDLREQILDAALTELTAKSIDAFSLEGVAARAGVDPLTVRQFWPSTPEIYTAALIAYGERYMPIPDTGTLRGDLLEFSRSYAAAINSPQGHRVLEAVVISRSDWDVPGSRETFRDARPSRLAPMIERAVQRGECRVDIDAVLVTDLLSSSLCTPVLFYGQQLSDDYAERVVDVLLNGILTPSAIN